MKWENRSMNIRPGLSLTLMVRNEYGGAFFPTASSYISSNVFLSCPASREYCSAMLS